MFVGKVSVYYDPASEYWLNSLFAVPATSKEEALSALRKIADGVIARNAWHGSFSVEVALSAAPLPERVDGATEILSIEDDDEFYSVKK